MNDVLSRIHNDARLANFIEASRTPLRIAGNTDSLFSLIVPLWFLFDGEAFWCITHKDAKLLTHLRRDQRVGFEIANNEPPYAGARGHGTVELIAEKGVKKAVWLLGCSRVQMMKSLSVSILCISMAGITSNACRMPVNSNSRMMQRLRRFR